MNKTTVNRVIRDIKWLVNLEQRKLDEREKTGVSNYETVKAMSKRDAFLRAIEVIELYRRGESG